MSNFNDNVFTNAENHVRSSGDFLCCSFFVLPELKETVDSPHLKQAAESPRCDFIHKGVKRRPQSTSSGYAKYQWSPWVEEGSWELWRLTGAPSTLSEKTDMGLVTSADELEGPITWKEGSVKRDGVTEKWNFYSPWHTSVSGGMLLFIGPVRGPEFCTFNLPLRFRTCKKKRKESQTAALTIVQPIRKHRSLLTSALLEEEKKSLSWYSWKALRCCSISSGMCAEATQMH